MLKKNLLSALAVLCFTSISIAQVTLDYYLPDNVTYNPNIPTPKEVIGHEVGQWHITHDKLVQYMYAVAEASDRVTITEYARTYEDRPLVLLTITSPANHRNIETIRQNHLSLMDSERSRSLDLETMPVVVNLGYSVHGNEPSGSNGSPAVLYHLAAAQGAEIDELLNHSIILLDPSLNPDGLTRFATWVNMHKSITQVSDSNHREFSEVWPGGRTNHYWFDLNRDWLPVVHPESRGRIQQFQKWKPNVLTDFHEMGTNATYFFQPGIPSRTHPLTPQINQDLTGAIAEFHADALNEIQSLYYTKESFDDFYYGKGSTYPDIQGSIGILFEQASSRGHAQESVHGVLEFPFTIRNQVITSFSSLKAALNLRTELLEYTRSAYLNARQEAARSPIKAYVIGDYNDNGKNYHLADMMSFHNIEFYNLERDMEANGFSFKKDKAIVIPTDQAQFKLITAMMERRTEFTDSLFYDVSTWTLPYAFNVPFAELGSREFNRNLLGERITEPELTPGRIVGGKSNYAYAFEWDEYYAPRALYRLQKAGVRAKVASELMSSMTSEGLKNFDYGTIVIALGIQDVDENTIYNIIQTAAREDGVTFYGLSTGLASRGIDLGSSNMNNLRMPEMVVLAGSGTTSAEVGEIWHQFDQRYQIPVTIMEKDRINSGRLSRYNVMVMVNGGYNDLSSGQVDAIRDWVRGGGTLILQRSAINWARSNGLANVEFATRERPEVSGPQPYNELSAARGAQGIGGSIFHARLDLTHPLAYGFRRADMTVFRNTTTFYSMPNNPYASPLYYTDEPLASGYISSENLETIRNTASIIVSGQGGGRVIAFADNPNFRAFWFGTNKLFANAVFFGNTISGASAN